MWACAVVPQMSLPWPHSVKNSAICGVFLVGGRRLQVLAGLLLEGGLDLRIVEEVGPVEVDLDEGFHRDAEEVAVGVLEVVGEGGEVALVEVRRLERGVVLQALGDVDEEVSRQVGVDDVLLGVDHVIDAGLGLHVLDGLVVHLVPGGRLDLDLDPGFLLELGRQHVLDVVRRRRGLGDAVQRDALELRAGVGPEVGPGRRRSGQQAQRSARRRWPSTESPCFSSLFCGACAARAQSTKLRPDSDAYICSAGRASEKITCNVRLHRCIVPRIEGRTRA